MTNEHPAFEPAFPRDTQLMGSRKPLFLLVLLVPIIMPWLDGLLRGTLERTAPLPFYWWGVVLFALFLVVEWFRTPQRYLRYHLEADALVIEWEKGRKRILYADIAKYAMQAFPQKPTAIGGSFNPTYMRGLFKWRQMELYLYATRRDQLLLLDTQQGLIGISPKPEEAQRFLQLLAERTGITVETGAFQPRYVREAVAYWKLLVVFICSSAIGITLMDAFTERGTLERHAWQIVGVGVIPVLLTLLATFGKLRGRPLANWMAWPALAMLTVLLMLGWSGT